ncbi:ankyrin repeat domain-containing protein [Aspergillus stella-maris]|uniref:ankyrin repeat domain-containing protein n=1 Tax=Aspergillus stella-maris TaxID=1810926 RepID=UPI003CCCA7F3
MLSWISTTPYEKYFRAARADILPNTGQWLFQNSEFGQWLQSKSGVFWLRGKPGAGKTKTSAMLVETLKTQEENIAFFFCSRSLNSSDRQDPKIILRSFVHQLSVRLQHDQFPKLLRETFRKRHSSGMGDEGLDYPECLEILNALLASDSSTTIVIDAIDECNMEDRNALLASLQQLLDLPGILLRIFISSRADPDITVRLNQWPSVAIEEALTRQDMERFVQREVTQAIERKLLLYGNVSSDLEAKIIGALLAKSGGMFLWVRLQLQLLCHMQTEYQVLSSLDSLPPTLRTTYDQIYEGIERSPSAHEAQTALAWLACARQPLRPDQWAVAVSWTIRKKARPEDKGVIYLSAETLLGMCQSLLIHDEMQNCITYAHVSVREYLESKGMLSTSELEFMGAEASLRFLINTRLPRPSQQGYRFYRYAARYWIDHVKGCGYSVPPGLDEFLGTGRAATQPYLEWKGAVELFCRRHREYHHADEIGTLTNGLLLAAHYGLGHIQMWKHSRYDPNITDERGFSLIAIASQNGQAGIVRTLLRNGAAVNPPRTPLDTSTAMCIYQARRSYGVYFQDPIDESHCLFLAIQGGHAEVVMLLLEAGATFVGISAFKVAARHGPPNVLLKILEQGTQEEVTDQILVLAAMNRRNPKTLETALQACPDQSITGHVLQAILEGRGDPKHIFKTYLAGRISAHVLTGIWRSQRREVLERLLAYIPDLLVLEETVLELESDALPGEDCVVEVLNSLLPGGTIMPTTLKAVFRIGEGAFCLMELLLRSKSLRSPQASDGSPNDTNNEEPLGQLFKRQVRFYVTDEAIVVAMQNEFDALKFAEIIFNLNSRQAISLEILKAAVNNEQLGGKLLDFFFSLDRDVPITEAIVAAAARNRFGGGLRMVDMLFSKAPGLQVTDTIIEAAAANSMSGSEILKWLLERRHTATAPDDKATFAARDGPKSRILGLLHMKNSGSAITEATVIAAVSSEFESMKTLPVLLARDPGLPITEKVLVAAAKNPERGFEIMKILLQQTLDVHIPESVFSAAVQNVMDASGLVGLLLSRADILTISEELVLSASRSPQGGGRVMADILSSDIISVKTSAVRAAAVTRQASWFSDFLSYIDHRTVRRQYGAIFMSAIEGGDAQILEQCLDIYSLWNGLDKHGWSTQLMAYYRHDDRVWDICRHHVGLVTARPLPPSSWKVRARDASGVRLEGAVLCLDGEFGRISAQRSDYGVR